MIDPETGTEYRRITPDNGRWHRHVYTDISPWPTDKNYLVYASGYEDEAMPADIYLTSSSGLVHWRIADDGLFSWHVGCFQAWAPDGMGVYYRSHTGDRATVYLDLRTMSKRVVGPFFRSLSADGMHVLYREIGQLAEFKKFGGNDLCVMDTDGTGHRQLVSIETLEKISGDPATLPYGDRPLTFTNSIFSPDGRKVLFGSSWGEAFAVVSDCHFCRSVEIIKVAGSGHRDWYPDSERIVYMGHTIPDGTLGICSVRWDGTCRRIVCDDESAYGTHGSHPCVSPDGKRIVSEGVGPGEHALYVLNERTGEGSKLVNCPPHPDIDESQASHMHPVWNHDGTQVAYGSAQEGVPHVYIAEVPAD